jgi:ABC-type antimicrobial peptide transport system permease subunit
VSQGAGEKTPTLFEIVGVVGDTRVSGLEADARAAAGLRARDVRPQVYLPYTSVPVDARTFLVRTSVDPRSLVDTLRREIAAVNPDVAIMQGRSARDSMLLVDIINRATFAAPKFGLGLMAAFAAVGLILAAIGVFSVMSYTVSLQTRDIGIRMALGARASSVMRAIVLKGLLPIAIGAAVGVGAAYGLSQLMANQIYGVAVTDPWTFTGVVMVLGVVGLLACVLPARRAMRVDPLIALRSE